MPISMDEKYFRVYPLYFDAGVSISKGRKCPVEKSIQKPTFKEIKQALDLLGIKHEEEPEKIHPKETKEKGRFKIFQKTSKREFIGTLVAKIKELREKATTRVKSSGNPLNLVPKSRKKAKKLAKEAAQNKL